MMTMNQVIAALKELEPSRPVVFSFATTVPTTVDSYRGYYDQPALGWAATGYDGDAHPPEASALLEHLEGAIGAVFTGWKGGDYRYSGDETLWVANPGSSTGNFITGLDLSGYFAVLIVGREEGY
jgi:hypothetical protein